MLFRHLYIAELSDGEVFQFKNVPEEVFIPINVVIDKFKEFGVSESHVIQKLLEHLTTA